MNFLHNIWVWFTTLFKPKCGSCKRPYDKDEEYIVDIKMGGEPEPVLCCKDCGEIIQEILAETDGRITDGEYEE